MVSTEVVLSGVLSISLLVFSAKILAGLFSKMGLPAVIGELSAGIIFGPNAIGGFIVILGHKVIELSEVVIVFAQIGAILILFTAGLEMTFAEFRGAGLKSFVVGGLGVVIPFFSGFYLTSSLGYSFPSALIVGAALTATSVAITLRVLEELGRAQDVDSKIMINAAVVDDVLGFAVLAVVISVIAGGEIPSVIGIAYRVTIIIILWIVLLSSITLIVPRAMKLLPSWRATGTDEAAATVVCFGSASLATVLGLSPIVGAYAAGMALAGSHSLKTIRSYIEKINMIFAPIFFAVVGASFNATSLSPSILIFLVLMLGVAIFSKLVGCGLPAAVLMRSRKSGWRIGVGMTSRGEVGLVISGIGITSGVITNDVYVALVSVIILTTIISPILLKFAYSERDKVNLAS